MSRSFTWCWIRYCHPNAFKFEPLYTWPFKANFYNIKGYFFRCWMGFFKSYDACIIGGTKLEILGGSKIFAIMG